MKTILKTPTWAGSEPNSLHNCNPADQQFFMTHTYTLSGMTCHGCVAKVKSQILKHPDVLAAEVSLDPQQAVIQMSKHIRTTELQKIVSSTGPYVLTEQSNGSVITDDRETRSWIETYKPILLIFAFISGVSFYASFENSQVHWMTFMTTFMAGFFLVFSFFKFLDLKGFASSYAMYDIVAKRIPVYGLVYPFLELGLGIAYLTSINATFTNWATVVIMGVSSVGVIESVLNKKKIQCACLGAVFNLPMSTVTIVEDLLMVGMAGLMLFLY